MDLRYNQKETNVMFIIGSECESYTSSESGEQLKWCGSKIQYPTNFMIYKSQTG